MSNIVARSIFNTTVAERSWKTQVTSIVIHGIIIAGAFLITFPVAQEIQTPRSEHVTLIAPYIPHPHVTIEPPHIPHVAKLATPVVPAPVKPPAPVLAKIIPPPVVPKPEPKLPAAPTVPIPVPEPKLEAEAKPLPAPKPVIKTGVFEDTQTAKAAPVPKQMIVGGFGDVHGVQSSDKTHQPVLLARVGSFDSPTGAGQSGGGGHLDSGSLKQAGFGDAGTASSSNRQTGSGIKTGGFGDSTNGTSQVKSGGIRTTAFGDGTAVASAPRREMPAAMNGATPVEILFKPRPAYSSEARGMRLEGQVSLEVVFQASGAVKVVRVIKGLGHGLDEAAEQAAGQVRFKPATKGGAPVDTSATINITFELT